MMMSRWSLPRTLGAIVTLAVLAAGLGMGGCATKYNELLEANRALTDRNQTLTQENETLVASNQTLQQAVSERDRALGELRALAADLRAENSNLSGRYGELNDRLAGIKFGQLDAETDSALEQLAAQYPGLITYDRERGMVRFSSDLTFGSGSAEVTEQGRRSLDAFAKILAGGAASQYDIKVLGHTDSQRISAGTAKQHPTNWHLSAHRAISVMSELTRMGVSPERVEVAGRGEFQPAVQNSGTGNTQQNRRVEIYMVRAGARTTPPAGARSESSSASRAARPAAPARRPAAASQNDDINK